MLENKIDVDCTLGDPGGDAGSTTTGETEELPDEVANIIILFENMESLGLEMTDAPLPQEMYVGNTPVCIGEKGDHSID